MTRRMKSKHIDFLKTGWSRVHNTFECTNPSDKVTEAELYLIVSSFLQMEI